MILAANRCRDRAPSIYVADSLSEIASILNPKLGDIAMIVAEGDFDTWRLVSSSVSPDGLDIIQSNACEYVWVRSGTVVNVAPFIVPGSDNDTPAFEQALAIAGAERPVYIPYRSTPYHVSNLNINIEGQVIISDNAQIANAVDGFPIIHITRSSVRIKGMMSLLGPGKLSTTDGLLMGGDAFQVEQCEIEALRVFDCRYGIEMRGTVTNDVILNRLGDILLRRCQIAWYPHSLGATHRVNANSFVYLSTQNSDWACDMDGADGNEVTFWEAEVNTNVLKIKNVQGLTVNGMWWELITGFKYFEDGPANLITGIRFKGSTEGDWTSTDAAVSMDRSETVERTFVLDIQTTTTYYGLLRIGAQLRIGEDGKVSHNQSGVRLQVASQMECFQNAATSRFVFRGDSGLGGWMFLRDGVTLVDLTPAEMNVLPPIEATSIEATTQVLSPRLVAGRLDYAPVVVVSSDPFTFNFALTSRYRIESLAANSTFDISNPTGSDVIEQEIWVDVVAGGGFTLTTANASIVWLGRENVPLGNNERLKLRIVDLVVYAEWVSNPLSNLSVFANNAAAVAGGVPVGGFYRTGADPDVVCVVH